MEEHCLVLAKCCRVCGYDVSKCKKFPSSQFVHEIEKIWGINASLDSPNVHPTSICSKCRSFCINKRYLTQASKPPFQCLDWTVHGESCIACMERPFKQKRGRKRKREQQGTERKEQHDAGTDSASDKEEEQEEFSSYSLFMEDVNGSLLRMKENDKEILLRELLKGQNRTAAEMENDFMNMVAEERRTLLTRIMQIEELGIVDIVESLPAKILELFTYRIFNSQRKKIAKDAQSFCQTYKNIDIIKSIDRAAWLKRRNPVLMAAVNGLAADSVLPMQKCLLVEHLYKICLTESLVLPFSFLVTLILFTITNSKLALNVTGSILPGGKHTTVTTWRDSLAAVPPPFPAGDCIVAFDNDQIVQKKWKVKAGEKARVSILTSICHAKIDTENLQQKAELAPRKWQYYIGPVAEGNEEKRRQLKESLEVTGDEQTILQKENYLVIDACLKKVHSDQKNMSDGQIVDSIDEQVLEMEKRRTTKICGNCGAEMPKKKRNCTNCEANMKAAEEQLCGQDVLGTALIKETSTRYRFKEKEVVHDTADGMSVRTVFEDFQVEWEHVPSNLEASVKISVSDPVFVNPSSYSAVGEVLRSLGKTAKVTRYGFTGDDAREWVSVTMDGLPYILAMNLINNTKLCVTCCKSGGEPTPFFDNEWKKHVKTVHNGNPDVKFVREFDWVMLRIGPLHVEMNMAKTFVAVNWVGMMEDLAKEMGFTSEPALKYARSASNHHQTMTMLDVLQRGGWCELLLPYVRETMTNNATCSVDGFIKWIKKIEDDNVVYLFEQLWTYLGALKVYHIGIRRNNTSYIDAGLKIFAPMFSYHPYSSKYQLIELRDRCDRSLYPDELSIFAKRTESVTTSTNLSKGEGLDARLEEVNKTSKAWAVGAMTATEWIRIFRNYDNLLELRENALSWLGVKDPKDEIAVGRTRDNLDGEVAVWRQKLRAKKYVLSPKSGRPLVTVSGKESLDPELLKLTVIGKSNREAVFNGVFLDGKNRTKLDLKEVYITKEERAKKSDIKNQTKAAILDRINDLVSFVVDENTRAVLKEKASRLQAKIDRTKKEVILALYNEAQTELQENLDGMLEG